jgi:hypothetical protein
MLVIAPLDVKAAVLTLRSFSLPHRIIAVDCIGTRDRHFTRSSSVASLRLGSSSPFARSLVSIHVLIAHWCGLHSPNTESVLRRPMTCILLCICRVWSTRSGLLL